MADLTRLFSIGQKIRYFDEDCSKMRKGEIKSVFADHIIFSVPEISDHLWGEAGLNLHQIYPENNFLT